MEQCMLRLAVAIAMSTVVLLVSIGAILLGIAAPI
jgi:hypothetical protein